MEKRLERMTEKKMKRVISDEIDNIPVRRESARKYIGASGIGSECDAEIAFGLRGFPNNSISPSLNRIFQEGHRKEPQIIKTIRDAGFHVNDKNNFGRQHRFSIFNDHIVGNADGLIEINGKPYILEIKTMNDNSFKSFVRLGLEYSHKKYYAQVQMLMNLSGMDNAILVAQNKNNQEFHDEIIERDEHFIIHMMMRIDRILRNDVTKRSVDESDYICRSCFKADVCWQGVLPETECATCMHSEANDEVKWYCNKHDKEAIDVCEDYEVYQPKSRVLG